MVFYKNFIGVYDIDRKGKLIGYITEINTVIEFTGDNMYQLLGNFCTAVDNYIKSQSVIKNN